MRKFLIIAPQFYPRVGGYANAVGNLVKTLSESGEVAVTVVTPEPLGDSVELDWPQIEVVRLARYTGRIRYAALVEQVQWVRPISQLIRSAPWDLVLFESLENPLTLYLLQLLLGEQEQQRLAVRAHGTNAMEGFRHSRRRIDRFYWWLVKRILTKVQNITSTTRAYFKFIGEEVFDGVIPTNKRLGLISNIVWPPSQDVSSSSPSLAHTSLQGDASLASEPNVSSSAPPPPAVKIKAKATATATEKDIMLLSLGRMNPAGYMQKNFELIPRAVHLLRGRRKDIAERLSITIVGDGEMLGRFRLVLEDLQVKDHFNLITRLPNAEIRNLQRSASAVVLVSRFEGQSMFALEALAAGAPLILSKGTGVSDLVAEDGGNGVLVDPLDALDLADAIIQISDADEAALRRASTAHYTAYYRPTKVMRDLMDYADGLGADEPPKAPGA